jgi:hypothetical protein
MPLFGEVRRPLFFLACFALLLVVVVETGSSLALGGGSAGPVASLTGGIPDVEPDMIADVEADSPPGYGIGYLALVDGYLLFSVVMLGLSFLLSQRAYGRIQGIVTLIVSFCWIILSFIMALVAFVLLMVMFGLFVAAPFGTIAYLAIWGFFPVSESAAVLGLLLFLKLVFLVLLVLAQQKFLKAVALMIHIATSFVLQLVLGIVQGWLPFIVVSLGDQLLALVFAIVSLVGAIWAFIWSIPAVVNAIRVSASRKQ